MPLPMTSTSHVSSRMRSGIVPPQGREHAIQLLLAIRQHDILLEHPYLVGRKQPGEFYPVLGRRDDGSTRSAGADPRHILMGVRVVIPERQYVGDACPRSACTVDKQLRAGYGRQDKNRSFRS